jgi:SAM-dependent methyltransferase
MTVVDVGAGPDPDPRADETADRRPVADHQFDVQTEWPLPDGYATGVTMHHVIEHCRDPWHVVGEAARVLEPGGWLEITVPLGWSQDVDPDHEWRPTWQTFERLGQDREPWDPDVGLRLIRRDQTVYLGGPLRPLTPLFRWVARHAPQWGAHHADYGSLTAKYRRVDDGD